LPLYEYKCESCGDTFEVIQKFADEPLKVHEKCGGPVHRLMSAPAFQFKGTGWYVTDYAKGGASTPAKGDSSKGESAKSDSAKSDSSDKGSTETATKTETKTESKPASSSGSSKND
jgi:putative FmdB family regulatory protein